MIIQGLSGWITIGAIAKAIYLWVNLALLIREITSKSAHEISTDSD